MWTSKEWAKLLGQLSVICICCPLLSCEGQRQGRILSQLPRSTEGTRTVFSSPLPNSFGGLGFSVGDPDILGYTAVADAYSGKDGDSMGTGISADQAVSRKGVATGTAINSQFATSDDNAPGKVSTEVAAVTQGNPMGVSFGSQSLPTLLSGLGDITHPTVNLGGRKLLL
eukprot:jgi/Botrbrau1/18369/Bobra.0179s0087.1